MIKVKKKADLFLVGSPSWRSYDWIIKAKISCIHTSRCQYIISPRPLLYHYCIKKLKGFKVKSYLPLFIEFSQAKSNHFNSNLHNQEFCVRAKDFHQADFTSGSSWSTVFLGIFLHNFAINTIQRLLHLYKLHLHWLLCGY